MGDTIQLPNSAEILGLYGRICVNSYNILDSDMNSIGVGIYLGASIIDHSCKPNAVAVFEGTTILIRALVDIPRLDWSQIHISYIDVLNTTMTRRSELQSTYYFLCECQKCKEPEEFAAAAICASCEGPFELLTGEEDSCPRCAKKISSAFRSKFNEVTKFTAHHLETMKYVACILLSPLFICLFIRN